MFTVNCRKWMFFVIVPISGILSRAEERRFTVRDSIQMTTFSEPLQSLPGANAPISPDGRYFTVVTTRGLIKSNKVETSIRLFYSGAVQTFVRQSDGSARFPVARIVAKITETPVGAAESSYSPLISDLRWAPNSRALYFRAENSQGQHYLCKVNVRSGRVNVLSPRTGYDVERYSILNDLLVYTATRSGSIDSLRDGLPGETVNQDASVIGGLSIDDVLFSHARASPKSRELWLSRNGGFHAVANASSKLMGHDMAKYLDVLSISPNGRFVVKLNPVTKVPRSWLSYVPLPGYEDWLANLTNMSSVNYWRPRQYVLVDLTSGRSRPISDAPFGDSLAHLEAAQAVWSMDGRRLLFTNTFLSLDGVDASTRAQRVKLCSVAEFEVQTGETRCIVYTRDTGIPTPTEPKPLRLLDASFGATSDEVIVHLGWPREGRWQRERYRRSQGRWEHVDTLAESSDGSKKPSVRPSNALSITIKQDLNHPAVLWALDEATGKGKEIWNPNPQLANIAVGEVSVYRWKDPSGNEFKGGLIKPVGYVPGRRYPLVIQTHGFDESEFITDGPFTTGMAARPMASAGIMVLQVGSNHLHYDELSEAHDQVLGYESGIDKLVEQGLVDPRRVGIIGFSRTCWYVESALIEAPLRFAAASITDGIDQSYMQAMIFDPDMPSDTQRIYHSKPFGEGLAQWMELAPSFHLDKLRSPLLITAIKPASVLEEWEIYSSLYQQKKPVDFLYIPSGQHILQKPLDRLASQQRNVAWFRFWLEGADSPSSDERYEFGQWEKLRAMKESMGS